MKSIDFVHDTAVVILNFNGKNFLEKFLPSVLLFSSEADVVVADNASTDDSVSFMQQYFPHVHVIQNKTNDGYAGGYNHALKQLPHAYWVLLNSDVEVTENWLSPLHSLLLSDETIAAVQPKILDYKNRDYYEYAGAAGGFVDALAYPFCRGRVFETVEKNRVDYHTRGIFWASGACMLVRAEAFRAMGGFQEHFFAHMEEIDLCWRWQRAGWKLLFCEESTIYHVGGGTLPVTSPRKTFLNFRNGLRLLYYHTPTAQLSWKLSMRLLLDMVAALYFIFSGRAQNGVAVFKSIIDFLFHLPSENAYRKKWKKEIPTFRVAHQSSVWIVVKYFFQKKKTFDELQSGL